MRVGRSAPARSVVDLPLQYWGSRSGKGQRICHCLTVNVTEYSMTMQPTYVSYRIQRIGRTTD